MNYKIEIQSISDIITNSSSELYTIKSDVPDKQFREMWNEKLRELGFSEDDIFYDETIGGEIYMENGKLYLDYPVMCNVENIENYLYEWFGRDNVTADLF